MFGPPNFDPAMGGRRAGPPPVPTPLSYWEPGQELRRWDPEQQAWVNNFPAVTLDPRERTHYSFGRGSSCGPLRRTLGPCVPLPLDLTEDPHGCSHCALDVQSLCDHVHAHQDHVYSRA